MGKKKSAAQIRRMQERAAKRGETYEYTPPPPSTEQPDENVNKANPEESVPTTTAQHDDSEKENLHDTVESKKRREVAAKLIQELKEIESNEELKSKDRRSAKRKAEAIASEEVGMPADELIQWYEKNKQDDVNKTDAVADPKLEAKRQAAMKLQQALEEISNNEELKSKDRRSAKRKAEAIATEETDMAPDALLEWWDKESKKNLGKDKKTKQSREKNHDPYIAFIGQLSFDTTSEQLLEHIRSQLQKDFPKVRKQTIKIRILTDSKTKKSRGMAFCEVDDPELLYGLLKLHQTFLQGRRINVERSAGGNKNSSKRQDKIKQYRKEQEEYFAEVVDSILGEYRKTGELREDELDDGVIALCKRHSGPVVRAAVAKYIEGSGRDMDNPSAYLTFLITKFAKEGVYEEKEDGSNQNKHNQGPRKKRTNNDRSTNNNNNNSSRGGGGGAAKRLKSSSEFAKAGIDMSNSEGSSKISQIFPSARRGRGYMM